ncbi:MAG: DUF5667 domain-containing protein [Nanoarchaeota archaeon]
MKRGLVVLLLFIFSLIVLTGLVIAPSHPVGVNEEKNVEGSDVSEDVAVVSSKVGGDATFDAGTTPGSVFYFVDTTYDNLRLNFASEENKALVASEIHNERIAEVGVVAEGGSFENIERAIVDAGEKIEVMQKEISPEIYASIKSSTKNGVEVLTEVKEKVSEEARAGIENAINKQLVHEKKTEIVNEITKKIDELCLELIELVGLEKAISQEPRCDPDTENSAKWLKRKATGEGEYIKFDREAKEKFIDGMSICFNDPRECECEKIPIKSFSNTCFKIIPNVIKCQFEQDENACKKVEEISKGSESMFAELPEEFRGDLEGFFKEKQNEAFKKNAPSECVDAGARDFDSCSKIMFAKFAPSECVEAGATTREGCMKIMSEKFGGGFGGAPSECLSDGKFIGMDECRTIMMKKFLPSECAEANAFTPESCQAVMAKKFGGSEGFGPPGGFPPGFQPPSGFEGQIPNIQENFNQVDEQLQNVPAECEGLTQEECEAKTGKSFGGPEVPGSFVFKDGEAVQITQNDIDSISQSAETHVGEININSVREQVGEDISSLESGISSLEQAPTESAAEAVSETSEAPSESVSETTTTGSAILDFMNRL